MKYTWSAGLLLSGTLLATGCSSGKAASTSDMIGTFSVMITSMGRTDSDIMTVSDDGNKKILLNFISGITTYATDPNANGLQALMTKKDTVTLASQACHVDHSTGELDGNIQGTGTFDATAGVDLKLQFTPAAGTEVDFEVTGTMQ